MFDRLKNKFVQVLMALIIGTNVIMFSLAFWFYKDLLKDDFTKKSFTIALRSHQNILLKLNDLSNTVDFILAKHSNAIFGIDNSIDSKNWILDLCAHNSAISNALFLSKGNEILYSNSSDREAINYLESIQDIQATSELDGKWFTNFPSEITYDGIV